MVTERTNKKYVSLTNYATCGRDSSPLIPRSPLFPPVEVATTTPVRRGQSVVNGFLCAV